MKRHAGKPFQGKNARKAVLPIAAEAPGAAARQAVPEVLAEVHRAAAAREEAGEKGKLLNLS